MKLLQCCYLLICIEKLDLYRFLNRIKTNISYLKKRFINIYLLCYNIIYNILYLYIQF